MMASINPFRDIWMGVSFAEGVAGLVGNAVSTANIVGPANALITVGPGLAAPVTVTFECAAEDATNVCTPDNASWSAVNKGGFCGEAVAPFSITIDPADADYVADGTVVIRDMFECPCAFIRAVLSAPAPITVSIGGRARVQAQV